MLSKAWKRSLFLVDSVNRLNFYRQFSWQWFRKAYFHKQEKFL